MPSFDKMELCVCVCLFIAMRIFAGFVILLGGISSDKNKLIFLSKLNVLCRINGNLKPIQCNMCRNRKCRKSLNYAIHVHTSVCEVFAIASAIVHNKE